MSRFFKRTQIRISENLGEEEDESSEDRKDWVSWETVNVYKGNW
ncbi:hypothetical protein SLEP1_g3934 [Rubroshorea leprosula]|uniref:Uncharacterized protein n=1 Tax=Rubroshorea leprosula TaxID=152421 RepID=A0AAV5HVX4_9ROSI|nr:hypothetical protein SLEP1_g3934 [Rubroshorea leprosula]